MAQATLYNIRNDIVDNGRVRCPAFSVPLMAFDNSDDSDSEDYSAFKMQPYTVKAKKTWKKLYTLIMDKRTDIPIKQMAIKSKHEDVLFKQM